MAIFSYHVVSSLLLTLISKTFCNGIPALNESLTPLQNEFPTKCMGDLGCFETDPPFYHPILRPIALLPFNEDVIATNFSLYTPNNPSRPENIDHDYYTIINSSFNPYYPTKIIIHGFTVVPEENDHYDQMKNAILQSGNYNVILVDWSTSNQPPYFQAISNGRVVGAQVARLIGALQYYVGAAPEYFHIIGHSLGAAVAGWAGERIPRLGRITGLDPAGIYFYQAPPEVRLDTSDAYFVDVIITNGGTNYVEGIGTIEPIGHVNFYPNGGNTQPGCNNSSEPSNEEFDFNRNVCSHMRALELFIASVFNDRCQFVGTPCESYEKYKSGQCTRDKFWWRRYPFSSYYFNNEMGFHARESNYNVGQAFFLDSSGEPPYCIPSSLHTYRSCHYTH